VIGGGPAKFSFLAENSQDPILQGFKIKNRVLSDIIIENKAQAKPNAKAEKLSEIKLNNYVLPEAQAQENLNPELLKKSNLSSERNNSSKTNKNIKFGFCFRLKRLKSYFSTPSSDLEKKKVLVFENLNDYLDQRLNLIYYLRTLYTINIMNSLLFNPYQKRMLEYPFKPNIFSKEDLDLFGLSKKSETNPLINNEISEYFGMRLEEKKLDKYDRKIFKILPKEITAKIDHSRVDILEDAF